MNRKQKYDVEAQTSSPPEAEVLTALLPLYWVYKALGFVPLKIEKYCVKKAPCWHYILTALCLTLQTVMILRQSYDAYVSKDQDFHSRVQQCNFVLFYVQSLVLTCGFLYHIEEILKFLNLLVEVGSRFPPDKKGKVIWACWVCTGVLFILQITNYGLFIAHKYVEANATTLDEFVTSFELTPWEKKLHGIGIVLAFVELHSDIGYLFISVALCVFAIIKGAQFDKYNKQVETSPLNTRGVVITFKQQYKKLKIMLKQSNKAMSTLWFLNLAIEIISLLATLYTGVYGKDKNSSGFTKFLIVYNFSVGIFKTVVSLYLAAKLNSKAKKAQDFYGTLRIPREELVNPQEAEDEKFEILQDRLENPNPGMTGLDIVTISHRFILSLFGMVISYWIVIAQFQTAEK